MARDAPSFLAVLLFLSASLGCFAGISAVEIDPAKTNWLGRKVEQRGLRYFLPAPYLVIEELPGGQQTARIELAVDRSREFAVQPYSYGATNHAVLQFHTDGTLKSFQLTQDTTEVPKAVVDAVKELSLKQLELEEEARKQEAKQISAARTSGPQAPGARTIAIYRINGTTLDHAVARTVEFVATAAETQATLIHASKGTPERVRFAIAGRPLGQTDLRKIVFLAANHSPLSDDVQRTLRAAIAIEGGGFEIRRSFLVSEGARFAELPGEFRWNIP